MNLCVFELADVTAIGCAKRVVGAAVRHMPEAQLFRWMELWSKAHRNAFPLCMQGYFSPAVHRQSSNCTLSSFQTHELTPHHVPAGRLTMCAKALVTERRVETGRRCKVVAMHPRFVVEHRDAVHARQLIRKWSNRYQNCL